MAQMVRLGSPKVKAYQCSEACIRSVAPPCSPGPSDRPLAP